MEKILGMKGRTVIYITHDPEYARMADEIIFMQDGEIMQIIESEKCTDNTYFRSWSEAGTVV